MATGGDGHEHCGHAPEHLPNTAWLRCRVGDRTREKGAEHEGGPASQVWQLVGDAVVKGGGGVVHNNIRRGAGAGSLGDTGEPELRGGEPVVELLNNHGAVLECYVGGDSSRRQGGCASGDGVHWTTPHLRLHAPADNGGGEGDELEGEEEEGLGDNASEEEACCRTPCEPDSSPTTRLRGGLVMGACPARHPCEDTSSGPDGKVEDEEALTHLLRRDAEVCGAVRRHFTSAVLEPKSHALFYLCAWLVELLFSVHPRRLAYTLPHRDVVLRHWHRGCLLLTSSALAFRLPWAEINELQKSTETV
eukprot:Hpha_TRINITY_DN16338_c2_g2::TRINITY_DN16338_c2_g2_i1::g.57711::m.57711